MEPPVGEKAMQVLVPFDDSDPARAALEYAITMVPEPEITLLHVLNPSSAAYDQHLPYNYPRAVDEAAEAAEGIFETAEAIAADHDTAIETETVVGAPEREIVAFATPDSFDQIVIGNHGRRGVTRVLLGSVAERVVRRAAVPVTVVRDQAASAGGS